MNFEGIEGTCDIQMGVIKSETYPSSCYQTLGPAVMATVYEILMYLRLEHICYRAVCRWECCAVDCCWIGKLPGERWRTVRLLGGGGDKSAEGTTTTQTTQESRVWTNVCRAIAAVSACPPQGVGVQLPVWVCSMVCHSRYFFKRATGDTDII